MLIDFVYGLSQSGKTTWAMKLACYLFQKTGRRSRWYQGDGGAETLAISGALGPKGFIDILDYSNRRFPIETSQRICSGWWAKDPTDPMSPLYECSRDELATVGLMVWEGTSFMSDYLMGDVEGGMRHRMSRGEVMNNDPSFKFKDGETTFGGNSRTHYGYVQRKMLDNIRRCYGIVGPLRGLWTGHERRVDEDAGNIKDPLFGPDVCGKALTPRIGASFGNTVHLDTADILKKKKDPHTQKEIETTKKEYRAYLRTHFDPNAATGVRYFAGCRIPDLVLSQQPDFLPEYLTPPDPVKFYALLDEAETLNRTLSATPSETTLRMIGTL